MKKIVILGCENSHADMFLEYIKSNPKYSDVEVVGVYSHEIEASRRLEKNFGVKVLDAFDQEVGKVNGVIVTARHGDNHLKYARPYFQKGVTMFIDKPITISEQEAVELVSLAKEKGVKLTGGSSLRYDAFIQELSSDAKNEVDGQTVGGLVVCPISMNNSHGKFYFYAQHLVESVAKIFGYYPKSVSAFNKENALTVVFHYNSYDVTGIFMNEVYTCYYASRVAKEKTKSSAFSMINNPCFELEFDEFYRVLSGEEQVADFKNFISPVFIMNAIERSIISGKEEIVKEYEV